MNIRWKRVLAGAFLAEVGIFVLFIPAVLLLGQQIAMYVAVAAAFAMTFLFGVWVGRGIESRFVLHGVLLGILAILIYVAISLAQPEPLLYIIANGLKIVGGVAGCRLAERRREKANLAKEVSEVALPQ